MELNIDILCIHLQHSVWKYFDSLVRHTIKQTLFLQIFGLVAFIEQKENDNNDNLYKIHGSLNIASALMTSKNNDVIV